MVKVNPLSEAFRFFESRVQKKDDAEGKNRREQSQQQKRDQEPEASYEQVQAAVDAFGGDAQTQANGLTASAVGGGPGLRVVLKDGSGAIVRQFTGEEFLRLREAATKDGRVRGKILDQKL
jgi:hypothetical protein